jgi:hypothetical protein
LSIAFAPQTSSIYGRRWNAGHEVMK